VRSVDVNIHVQRATNHVSLHLAAFTIEVYMAVVHPIMHKNAFNHRLVTIVGCVLLANRHSVPCWCIYGHRACY
jgi:hypothetical protein